jgi:hypothetical protein
VLKVAFSAGLLNERGTSVAVFDYADHLERCGMGDAVILHHPESERLAPDVFARFRARFRLIADPPSTQLPDMLARENVSVLYKLKPGTKKDDRCDGVRNVNHVIFRHDEPHGDRYAYISEWLTRHMTGGLRPWVPHIVDMPEPRRSLREQWGIPNAATVLGRHGGFDQFNVPFVPKTIERALEERKDLWFVFVNTEQKLSHPRVIHLPTIFDPQSKADFIGSCDGMIHARKIGESFGLAMAEFLALDKPVICWAGGADRHHLAMQPDPELVFASSSSLLRILRAFGPEPADGKRRASVADFAPAPVMERFRRVFLDGPDQDFPPTPSATRAARWLRTRATKSAAEWWIGSSKVENALRLRSVA